MDGRTLLLMALALGVALGVAPGLASAHNVEPPDATTGEPYVAFPLAGPAPAHARVEAGRPAPALAQKMSREMTAWARRQGYCPKSQRPPRIRLVGGTTSYVETPTTDTSPIFLSRPLWGAQGRNRSGKWETVTVRVVAHELIHVCTEHLRKGTALAYPGVPFIEGIADVASKDIQRRYCRISRVRRGCNNTVSAPSWAYPGYARTIRRATAFRGKWLHPKAVLKRKRLIRGWVKA